MILKKNDYTQLVSLVERYRGVDSIGDQNIVVHVCKLRLGIKNQYEDGSARELIGDGTVKECMSLRNAAEIRDYCDEQVFEFGSLTTLNGISMDMGNGVLDCITIDSELEQMYLRSGYLGETVFYNEVMTIAQEAYEADAVAE